MSARSRILLLALILTLAAGIYGLYRLVLLRFESGDIFPPSSSLREDPFGSKALYMALERISGLKLSRNYRQLERLADSNSKTILLLGTNALLLDHRESQQKLEILARSGSRLIVALDPKSVHFQEPATEQQSTQNSKATATPEKTGWLIKPVKIQRTDQQFQNRLMALAERDALPQGIPFIEPLAFEAAPPNWQTVYSVAGHPVMLERRFGNGSIVIISESFLLSNEAMRDYRYPDLLSWLIGPNKTIVFDESHLGVSEQTGVVSLAKRFGLMPFAAALFVLAMLYLWRSSIPLIPGRSSSPAGMVMAAGSHFSGLTNLLQRSVPPKQLLRTCLIQWQKSATQEIKRNPAIIEDFQQIANSDSNPVDVYNRITRTRTERNLR